MSVLVKWSVEDYHRMIEAGILRDRRVELLAGNIFEMAPKASGQDPAVTQIAEYLAALLKGHADVCCHHRVTLTDSEPEPAIAVVQHHETTRCDRQLSSADIFWLIEVSRANLKQDLELKAAVYAAAAIQEYWVLDLSEHQLIVFRHPEDSTYLEQRKLRGGRITPLAFKSIAVSVERLLT